MVHDMYLVSEAAVRGIRIEVRAGFTEHPFVLRLQVLGLKVLDNGVVDFFGIGAGEDVRDTLGALAGLL